MDAAWIVVTDLDGTLLDHHDYSYEPASEALDKLRLAGIPLILNTSKTRGELMSLRARLANTEPFIVENGSAVFVPCDRFEQPAEDVIRLGGYDCRVFGRQYAQILDWLRDRCERYRFEGFSDYSVADLVQRTGLSEAQARLALAREFSEPLIWQDTESVLAEFEAELAEAGLSSLRGGRFLHVLGCCDKGQSLSWLRQRYCAHWRRDVRVVALGDSDNDVAMLEAADIAVVIRSPRHAPPSVRARGRLIVSDREGPGGWSDAINTLLDNDMIRF